MFRSGPKSSQKFSSQESAQQKIIMEYEEEIETLQSKLMETHNKLIEQLDICRDQELTIIDLTEKLNQSQSFLPSSERVPRRESSLCQQPEFSECDPSQNNSGTFNNDMSNSGYELYEGDIDESLQSKCTFNRNQSHQKQGLENAIERLGGEFTLNNSKQFITPLQNCNGSEGYQSGSVIGDSSTNELLKADLEAMRNRLLQEIVQHSRVKEELERVKRTYLTESNQYKKQISDLQQDHEHLLREYEFLSASVKQARCKENTAQKQFSSAQFNELTQKCAEYEQLYNKETKLNQSLNHKIIELRSALTVHKDKVKELEEELERYGNCVKSTSTADGQREEREELCGTIRRKGNGPSKENQNGSDNKAFQSKASLGPKQLKVTPSAQIQQSQPFVRKQTVFYQQNTKVFANAPVYSSGEKVQSNKQNIHPIEKSSKVNQRQGFPSKHSSKKSNRRDDYESTKDLIKKLQEAEMQTRMKKRHLD